MIYAKLLFCWYLATGQVTKADVWEGQQTYSIHLNGDTTGVDYALKYEVLNFIKTGEFHYDDRYHYELR